MINDKEEGLSGYIESFNYEDNNNQDNNGNGNVDQQNTDNRDENDDPYFELQNNHENEETLDLIRGISNISSNNPSIQSYQMSEVQRPGLTENSNHGTVRMSITEVTRDKTKK